MGWTDLARRLGKKKKIRKIDLTVFKLFIGGGGWPPQHASHASPIWTLNMPGDLQPRILQTQRNPTAKQSLKHWKDGEQIGRLQPPHKIGTEKTSNKHNPNQKQTKKHKDNRSKTQLKKNKAKAKIPKNLVKTRWAYTSLMIYTCNEFPWLKENRQISPSRQVQKTYPSFHVRFLPLQHGN